MVRNAFVGIAAFAAGAAMVFGAASWRDARRAPDAREISVEIAVDFGPLNKPPVTRTVRVPEGATVLSATRAAADVRTAFVCCDPEDVLSINGVACDPENEGWWLYEYNGLKGPVSAHRLKLFDGDRVRWFYVRKGPLARKRPAAYREAPPAQAGEVRGRVRFSGTLPDLPPFAIHKNADVCAACPGETHKPHPCRPAARGPSLAGAVVWLPDVPAGKGWADFPFPERPILDQKHCVFTPHLIVTRRGAILELRNGDPTLHTVHAYDETQTSVFNVAQAGEGSMGAVTLDRAGVLDLICDAGHRWMKAHVVVVETPYVAVTGADGTFRIDGVPPGTHRINVWHDLFGKRVQTIETRAGEAAVCDVTFDAREFRVDLRYAR